MELLRIGALGAERPVARLDGLVYDLTPLTADIDPAFFAADGVANTMAAIAAGALPTVELDPDERIGAPIARPTAILCIGQNYAAHAAESGSAPPEQPILFFKHPNTIVGPYDDVIRPVDSTQLDWELELGVVIGRRAERLASAADALDHVAGYVVGNDVSERRWQRDESGGQWSKGKSAPTFCPLGPALVTTDTIGDPGNLRLQSWVNDEPRQQSDTADMIFDVATIVHHLSHYVTLEPGDLILTGTPEGVAMGGRFPFLVAGDVFRAAIAGLGEMRQRIVDR